MGDIGVRSHSVCTIVARNYIAQARVLVRSFTRYHPGVRFSTLVIDGNEEDRGLEGLGEVVLPGDLGLAPEILNSMCTMYDVMEYATALKPAMLMYLHREGAKTATYFDPDIRVYGPLDDIFQDADQSGIFLTPHMLAPLPRDGLKLTEADIMHSGIYNLGFISTGSTGYQFLAWWHHRLITDAVVDLANALFTDQRWVDWAPAVAAPHITRDRGLNAAYWNLHERPVTRSSDGSWRVGADALRFFHFSGFDPAKPWLLSKHLGDRPRILLSEHPALLELCDEYAAELVDMGHIELRKNPYRNNVTPDGMRLTPLIRRMYRSAVLDPSSSEPTPNPLDDPAAFREWLLDPTIDGGSTRFSRYDYAIWGERIDVQQAFPAPFGADAPAFRSWLDVDAGAARYFEGVSDRKTISAPPHVDDTHRQRFGWSVVGYARAELGVGEAGRRLSRAVGLAGVPWEMVGLTKGSESRQRHAYQGELRSRPTFCNTIACVNADQTPMLHKSLDLRRTPRNRRIGYWFWELEAFPESQRGAFDVLDEIWVSSEFNRASLARLTDKPVRVVPTPIMVPRAPTRYTREMLGLPVDKRIFLVNFDFLSVMARKNPIGAIEAYLSAFGPDDGACLVVKSINGHLRPIERERVRLAIGGRPDIILRDEYLNASEMNALSQLVDCVVSLHRSEGYGLNLADAMAAGTPVVATGYSGNMTFMDEASAFLIPHAMIEVGADASPYAPDATWADPSLVAAAEAMRSVFDDPDRAALVAATALKHIEQFSVEQVAQRIASLLHPYSMIGASAGAVL